MTRTDGGWGVGYVRALALSVALLVVAVLAGCTHDANQGEDLGRSTQDLSGATLVSISVTPPTASVPTLVAQQFKATGTYSDGTTKPLTSGANWTVSDPSIATVSSGLVTPLGGPDSGIGGGTIIVTATDPVTGISGTASLTITTATLVSMAVTPGSKEIVIGTSQTFKATGTFSDGTKFTLDSSAVIWTSTNPEIATVDYSGGVATGVSEGTVTVVATNPATGLSAQAILIVGSGTLVSVAVTPATDSIPKGLTATFVATGMYSDGTTMDLTELATWSSSATGIAKVSNVTGSNGVATGTGVGTATITAKIAGVSGTASLTVTAALLESIAVTPLTATLPKGTTKQLTATGTYSDGTSKNLTKTVTWTSALPGIVSVSNASGSYGLATALALGSTTVVATDPTTMVSSGATLTVTAAVLKSLAVTPTSASVPIGLQKSYTATGTFTDLTTQNMTATVLWTSSDPTIATISNAAGSAGAATAVSVGTTSITAYDPASGIGSKAATLNATAAVLKSITVSPPTATIPVGFGLQYSATGLYSDGSSQNLTSIVTWKVTAGSATISNAAGSQGLVSTTKIGLDTIQATSGSIKATAALSVTSATLSSVSVTPAALSIALGTTQSYVATGIFTDGTKLNLTGLVTWSASNGDAVVSNAAGSQGVATGTAVGLTTIFATYPPTSVTGSTSLNVSPAALVSIAITPPSPSIPAGLTKQFVATGTFTDLSTQDLLGVTWSTGSPAVMTVSNATGSYGLGTALAPGTTFVTATDPTTGIAGQTSVTVTSAILVSVAITPSTANLPLGTFLQLAATGRYSDKSTQVLTNTVTWASSTGSISVANAPAVPVGLATSLSVGPAVVTATDPTSGISGTATLTATPATLVSIYVSPSPSGGVPSGYHHAFLARGTYTDGSTMDIIDSVTWSSSDPSVVVISNASGSQGVAAAGLPGTATLTATDPATGITGLAAWTTTVAVLVAIDVTPPSPSIPAGLTSQLTATGIFSDGSSHDITSAVTWTTSSVSASVSNAAATAGLVTGLTVGTATVVATDPLTAYSGQSSVTVTAAVPASLSVTPTAVSLLTGQTQPLTATITMTDGTLVNVTGSVTWSSSSATVYISTATPSYGMITAVSVGGATVTATDPASGLTASTAVTVALQTNDSAAAEFSPYVNPVGNWAFGGLSGGSFQLATASGPDGAGDDTWVVPGLADVAHNGTGHYTNSGYQTDSYNFSIFVNGYSSGYSYMSSSSFTNWSSYVPPNGLALLPYGDAADARWTAPAAGVYTINATFGGEGYWSSGAGSCLMYNGCCTPYCHGCFIGQCWCGDNYCAPYSYSECNPYYVPCTVAEQVYTTSAISINLNGTPLFCSFLSASSQNQTFSTTISVNAGDTIDFAAGVGTNGTPYGPDGRYADTTLLSADIYTCPAGQANCSGTCIDVTSDPNNCGGCGLTCPLGCSAGECLVTLTSGQSLPFGIAVDSTNVYWTDSLAGSGSVMSVPIGGGAPTTLASGQDAPYGIAVDATSVYWVTYYGGTVMKVPLRGGSVTTVGTAACPWGVVVDSTSVYWTDPCRGQVASVPLAGGTYADGTLKVLASGQTNPNGIAVDGTSVYWTNNNSSGTVASVPLSGGAPITLAAGQSNPYTITVDGANVYWTNDPPSGYPVPLTTPGAIMSVPLSGGMVQTLASGQDAPVAIAVDATSVYWTDYNTNTVMTLPLSGGSPGTLFSGASSVWGIAVDATSVYVAEHNDGNILKLTPK